jgi:hypothetical protein
MKRYTIARINSTGSLVVLDNTLGSTVRCLYNDAIQLGSLKDLLTSTTNEQWLSARSINTVCELDNYLDLPKLHPELLI